MRLFETNKDIKGRLQPLQAGAMGAHHTKSRLVGSIVDYYCRSRARLRT